MIVIGGYVYIKSEKRNTAIQAMVTMQTATRKEKGCISYAFLSDLEDETKFYIFEEWEIQDALDKHFQTPHMIELNAVLPQVTVENAVITRYIVSEHGRLDV